MIIKKMPRLRGLSSGGAMIGAAAVVAGGLTAAVVLGGSINNAHPDTKVQRFAAAASSPQWLTTQAVAISTNGQAPEAPTLDTTSTALTADAVRLAAYLPGYTLAHQELMSWSAGDATEHFTFDSTVGEVNVFVNVLQQQEDVTPDPDDQLISLVTDALGTQTAVVHDGPGDHLVQVANANGVHVKVAATSQAAQTLGDSLLQQIAQVALAHNLAR